MPRLTKNGDYILTAGEIAAYVVCPESWRLGYFDAANKVRSQLIVPEKIRSQMREGEQLHSKWANNLETYVYLLNGLKFICSLTITAIVFYLLKH